MCGIAGFLAKREGVPVAESLVGMLQALYGRGPDSTGLSLYGAPHEGELRRLDLGRRRRRRRPRATGSSRRSTGTAAIASDDYHEGYFRIGLTPEDASPHGLRALADDVERANPGVRVFSLGHRLEMIKYTADARTIYDTLEPRAASRSRTRSGTCAWRPSRASTSTTRTRSGRGRSPT